MSRTQLILVAVSLLWFALWQMGSYLFFRGADSNKSEAAHVAQAMTPVTRGTNVRFEGHIAAGEQVLAPYSKTPCVAAHMSVSYASVYYDSQDRQMYDYAPVMGMQVGPTNLAIAAGNERLQLALEQATELATRTTVYKDEPPPEFHVTREMIASAEAKAGGRSGARFIGYAVNEEIYLANTPVFAAAHLSDDGRLEPDPVLKRVALFKGTQAQFVEKLTGSAGGMRIAGWIFIGLSLLPALVFAIYKLRGRRRG